MQSKIKVLLAVLACASIYPAFGAVEFVMFQPEPLNVSFPANARSVILPFAVKTPGVYILSVVARNFSDEPSTQRLLQTSTSETKSAGPVLTFKWRLCDSADAEVKRGIYGDRAGYFSPFCSEPESHKPLLGAEFGWIPKIEPASYSLKLNDISVPEPLHQNDLRLKMQLHSNPFDGIYQTAGLYLSLCGMAITLAFLAFAAASGSDTLSHKIKRALRW